MEETSHTAGSPRRRVFVLASLTAALTIGMAVAINPLVSQWLTIRLANRNLAHVDAYERDHALKALLATGEDPDNALIDLLHHSHGGVRTFAAESLASRPVTTRIVDSFLVSLESGQHQEDLRAAAYKVFRRHAESLRGPMSETDRRIMALLRPMLIPEHPDDFQVAMVFAEYLPHDSSLRKPLRPYVEEDGYLYGQLSIARGFYRDDVRFRERYMSILLAGVASGDSFDEEKAFRYLNELGSEAAVITPQLRALRRDIPRLAAQIDSVVSMIDSSPSDVDKATENAAPNDSL